MSKKIVIRFYEELNDFIPPEKRKKDIPLEIASHQNIKDVIEAQGIPHTEVDLILANGESVDFTYKPKKGDHFSVYPVFESLDIRDVTKLRPLPLRATRFILDVHLGKLTRYLRMLGYDSYYRNDLEDREIVSISLSEKRIILTRDLQLLKHGSVVHGYFVRGTNPEKQLREIIRRFQLNLDKKPFSVCLECNGRLKPIDKSLIEDRLEPCTRKSFEEFYICDTCDKVYWPGSHYVEMLKMIKSL